MDLSKDLHFHVADIDGRPPLLPTIKPPSQIYPSQDMQDPPFRVFEQVIKADVTTHLKRFNATAELSMASSIAAYVTYHINLSGYRTKPKKEFRFGKTQYHQSLRIVGHSLRVFQTELEAAEKGLSSTIVKTLSRLLAMSFHSTHHSPYLLLWNRWLDKAYVRLQVEVHHIIYHVGQHPQAALIASGIPARSYQVLNQSDKMKDDKLKYNVLSEETGSDRVNVRAGIGGANTSLGLSSLISKEETIRVGDWALGYDTEWTPPRGQSFVRTICIEQPCFISLKMDETPGSIQHAFMDQPRHISLSVGNETSRGVLRLDRSRNRWCQYQSMTSKLDQQGRDDKRYTLPKTTDNELYRRLGDLLIRLGYSTNLDKRFEDAVKLRLCFFNLV